MNKQSKPAAKSVKKITLEDLDQVVGGTASAIKIKIEVEPVPKLHSDAAAAKASGEA